MLLCIYEYICKSKCNTLRHWFSVNSIPKWKKGKRTARWRSRRNCIVWTICWHVCGGEHQRGSAAGNAAKERFTGGSMWTTTNQTVEKQGNSLWKQFSRYTPRRLSVLPVRQVASLDMVPERTPCPPANASKQKGKGTRSYRGWHTHTKLSGQ